MVMMPPDILTPGGAFGFFPSNEKIYKFNECILSGKVRGRPGLSSEKKKLWQLRGR
jgi:hypothetical protein